MFMAQEVELYANVNGKKIKETQQIVYHSTQLHKHSMQLTKKSLDLLCYFKFKIFHSFIHSFIHSFHFISIHSFWNSFILLFLNHFNCIVFQSFFIFVFDFVFDSLYVLWKAQLGIFNAIHASESIPTGANISSMVW